MKILNKLFYIFGILLIISAFSSFFFLLNGYDYSYIFIIIGFLCLIFCIFIYYFKVFYITFFGTKEQKEKLRRAYMSNEARMAEDLEIMKKEILNLKKENEE